MKNIMRKIINKRTALVFMLVFALSLIGCGAAKQTKETSTSKTKVTKLSEKDSKTKKDSKQKKESETEETQSETESEMESENAGEEVASASLNNSSSGSGNATSGGTASAQTQEANFPKEKAMAVLDLINAERAVNGVGQLVWDENMYNYACIRAQQITANFEHDYASPYGENIGYMPYIQTANDVHTQYYNSPGHHQNYLTGSYVAGAIAIYEIDGVSYHVELFSTTTGNSYGNTAAQQSAEAQEWGATVVATWTASNGIVFEILSDGNVGMHYDGYSDEQINAALAEFMSYMGFQY